MQKDRKTDETKMYNKIISLLFYIQLRHFPLVHYFFYNKCKYLIYVLCLVQLPES